MTIRNYVQLIGNIGTAPEMYVSESGKRSAKFVLATHESYRNAEGDRVQETQWHNIVAFGKKAVVVEKYLSKGCEIAITGKLVTRSYIDKQDIKRHITEVIVSEILLLRSQ